MGQSALDPPQLSHQIDVQNPSKKGPKPPSERKNPIKQANSGSQKDQKRAKIDLQKGAKNPVRGVMILPHLNCSDGTLTIGTKKHVLPGT
jgi:hypothetical protein